VVPDQSDCCTISVSVCHQRGNRRPCGMDGYMPVWELVDETSNTCLDNMNATWCYKIVAKFYKVWYKHTKRDVAVSPFVFVANFLRYVPAKN